ncbi:MAG: mechanosensitive ion channel [Desulfovibrionaceae bacterium]|nr:mechanosensitive ion channel [Desulfovibrionaceae bacterium]
MSNSRRPFQSEKAPIIQQPGFHPMPRKLAPFFVLLAFYLFLVLSLNYAHAKPNENVGPSVQEESQDQKQDSKKKSSEKTPAKSNESKSTQADKNKKDGPEDSGQPLPAPLISKEEHEQIKEQKQEAASIPELIEKTSLTIQNIHADLVTKHRLAAPWRERWNESRAEVKNLQIRVQELTDQFVSKRDLLNSLATHERHLSQLLPSINTYKDWASPMEAVNSRLSLIVKEIDREFASLYAIKAECEKLLATIIERSSLSVKVENESEDLKKYQEDLKQTESYIKKSLERQNADLAPINNLKQQIFKIQESIDNSLPELWKNYYLRPPLTWLDPTIWSNLSLQFDILRKSLDLRQSLEFPTDKGEWRRAIIRAVIGLFLCGIILFILSRQSFVPIDTNPTVKHCFTTSLPVIGLGVSLLLSSFSPGGNFHFFLSLGNIILILGQILLAWDLRLLSSEQIPRQRSPLLRLYPLTCIAYLLLYLPLLQPVLLVLWLFFVIATLIWRHFWPDLDIGNLKLEKNIRTADGLILWICLILTLIGLHMYSMILYLVCVSISLSLELCQGGINRINYLNENQPSEGISAILSGVLISLAAPIIMLIAVVSVLLWIATLPGGMILAKEYLFKNVSVGSAEFNLLHILIIISAFFLTKAIVSTGLRYIERVAASSAAKVDSTLVTPAQTAFTYIVWIIFVFFVLHILDIDLKNAAMVATGLSVGIGMGLQNIVQNFFSGLLLIFGRMLQVGDVIEVRGVQGQVAKISVRDTLVRTFDNAYIYVPNSEFISGHLVNWSRNDATVRASVNVGVAYGSDTALVVKTLRNIVNKHSDILRYPEPSVVFQNFGDNTLDFSVFFWVNQFSDRQRTSNEVRLQIEKEFREKNIEIAFPQLDVHIKKDAEKKTPLKRQRKVSSRQFTLKRQSQKTKSKISLTKTDLA